MLEEICLELTSRCNLKCLHCSSEAGRDGRDLERELAEKAILDGARLGCRLLELSGGEATLVPYFGQILRLAKEKIQKVYVYTSGFRVDIRDIASADRIIFSLQGLEETTDYIMGQTGAFEELMQGIKSAKDFGVEFGIHFVPMSLNYKELPEALELADKLGAVEFAPLRLVPQGRAMLNKNLALDKQQTSEFFSLLKKAKEKYEILRIGCPLAFPEIKAPSECKAGKSACEIRFNGDVSPCPAFKYDFIAGNLHQRGLKKIWNGAKSFRELRELNHREIEYCRDCLDLDTCRGRCAAQRLYANGSVLMGPDPYCLKCESTG